MAISRRIMMFTAAAAVAVAGFVGAAQAWEPNKPINFVIMAGKESGADKMARLMQAIVEENRLSPMPLIPVNKPVGSGKEALVVLKTTGDPNYTIMMVRGKIFTGARLPGPSIKFIPYKGGGSVPKDLVVIGAPDMSDEALAFYNGLFQRIYESKKW